ncbi:helix-turn-helix transcriptional regulator [Vibrio sp. 03-59-1]|uniref:helix-turn-helix domain-containing protein n=1 Tax=Vibrio sp. 03-59-1 TaxID=2607607 RepID=UPI001493AD69|nr:helix-turn-helix transcriptional regulator [Vibrio sp. 03-59-1]NOH85913.1 helix-turn-helix transcriptional regulator [Vibrio sp. 03-59-1]
MSQYPISAMLLHKARKDSGLKQLEFMKKHKLDVSQGTYSRWESGKTQVPASVLFDLKLVRAAVEL